MFLRIKQEVVEPMNRFSALVVGVVAILTLPTLASQHLIRTRQSLHTIQQSTGFWLSMRVRLTFTGQFTSTDAQRLISNPVISNGAGAQQQAAVAFDTTNRRFLVVWQDGRIP